MFLARFHALLRAHRCCLSVPSFLKVHGVRETSLMRIFDLYCSFVFSDNCLTERTLCEGCLVVRSGHGPQAEVAQGVGHGPLVEL